MPPRARSEKTTLRGKSIAKLAEEHSKSEVERQREEVQAVVRRGRRPALKLNKGSKVHAGILDLKENVAYCRVVFAGNNYSHRSGTDLGIVEIDRFVAWMNEKNGKHNGGPRFIKVEVVGADTDQRSNSGINLLYEEFFKENEDVRIEAALASLFDDGDGYGGIVVTKYKDGWSLNNSREDKGISGKWHIARIVEIAKVSLVKAREVFLERLRQEIGDEMFSKLDFVSERWAREIDEQRAARNATRD